MSDRIKRTLWLHSWTDKALLLSTTPLHFEAEQKGGWLPRSQIVEVERRTIDNPNHGPDNPGAAMILGTALTFTAPQWLLDQRGMVVDAELPE